MPWIGGDVLTRSVQDGPYNSKILNLESTEEPFPVKAVVRSHDYFNLIVKEATEAGVLNDAKMDRDK